VAEPRSNTLAEHLPLTAYVENILGRKLQCGSLCLLTKKKGKRKDSLIPSSLLLYSGIYAHGQDPPKSSPIGTVPNLSSLIGEVLQSLHHLCDPSLGSLPYAHICLAPTGRSTPGVVSPVLG